MPRKAISADRLSNRSTRREYRNVRGAAGGATIGSMCSAWLDDGDAFAVGLHLVALQLDGVIFAAQPRLELIAVVRAAGYTGIADVLHGQERVRFGEIDNDAVLRAGTCSVRRKLAAGVAQRVRAAIDFAGTDVERRIAKRMVPVRLMQAAPLPGGFVIAETGTQAVQCAMRHSGDVFRGAIGEVVDGRI